MRMVQHETYENMFYVEWDDGVRSRDFYNLARAKNHIKVIIENEARHGPLHYDSMVRHCELEGQGEV